MVNHGVSHACLTCKTRRIKCDEGKPTCRRCTKSRRTCLGYKEEAEVPKSASHSAERNGAVSHLPVSQASTPPRSQLYADLDPEARAAFARFFSNFVLISRDRSLSRGYFDGLQSLLATAGPHSGVFGAAKVVALANAANTSGSGDLLYRARTLYTSILYAFQRSLKDSARCNNDETLMTAALLGLYEMMVATEASPLAHKAHIRGVSAILCTRGPHDDIVPGVRVFRCVSSFIFGTMEDPRKANLLSVESCSSEESSPQNLDALLLRLRPVLLRATKILSNSKASRSDLSNLKQEAILMNKEFSLWPLCQPKEWAPQTLGIIGKPKESTDTDLESMPFWPGKLDSYFDLFVVAVWDTYRKSRLKLLQVVADCGERLRGPEDPPEKPLPLRKLQSEVRELVDGLCASIPFHLVADLHDCLQANGSIDKLNTPGKALGGLLLMYPLYIASTLSLIPLDQRIWMKGRLRWIGKHMGISQALMLAETDLIHHLAVADGHTLVFSGSLISPPATTPLLGGSP